MFLFNTHSTHNITPFSLKNGTQDIKDSIIILDLTSLNNEENKNIYNNKIIGCVRPHL